MNKSLVVLALLMCGVVKAQTGFVEFPYNPDSDGDDFIGITDLLSLLSLYESEFSEEGLYLTSDSTEALYYTGNMNYPQCYKSCHDLPGKWWIPSYEQILGLDLSPHPAFGNVWSNPICAGREPLNNFEHVQKQRTVDIGSGMIGDLTWQYTVIGCFCFTRERPKVEYTACRGNFYDYDIEAQVFTTCIVQKTSDGWYPLGTMVMDANLYPVQAFWRWKERMFG